MISYLEGRLLRKTEDRIVVLAGGVGYEVLLPALSRPSYRSKRAGKDGDWVELYVSYHSPERQPRPLLVGFASELEREFFERFITVEDIGPSAAVKALSAPVPVIARAIERKDTKFLRQLDGIGPRKAEKIVATLNGRVGKFALMEEAADAGAEAPPSDFQEEVFEALVGQFGHSRLEAQRMVKEALARNPTLGSAEELFEEVYRGEKAAGS